MNFNYQPKKHFSKGRTLELGKDLTPKQRKALQKGEVFVLLDKNKSPYSRILMDSYNQIREQKIIKQRRYNENQKH